jgi:uncharacterized protein (DUF362 family)
MERRKLLKTLAGVGLTSLVAPTGSILNNLAHAAQTEGEASKAAANAVPDMAIARGKEPAELVEAAMKALGGMERFISKGDKVLVKPNIGWDRTPEQAANTNPVVVRTIVEQCFKAGAKDVLVIDFTCNQARRCYTRSGIKKAAEEAGATVRYINDKKFKEMNIGGEVLDKWPAYTDIVESDKLINVPIAKHHTLATLSLSQKNWLGAIGGKRNALHQKLDESCVDLSMFFKPTLTVLDAVRILKANGPQGGNLKDVEKIDTLAAGIDEVAIDSFGTSLFGMKPEDIGYVKIGAERGWGQSDLSKLNVVQV